VAEDGHGQLKITAVDTGGGWTSGRIESTSDGYQAPAGGEMEVTASIRQPGPADGAGYWPAFWMLGSGFRSRGAGTAGSMDCASWPATGEIDIMEDVNARSQVSGTLHCGATPGGPCDETSGLGSGLVACSGCQAGFDTYSVIVNRTDTSDESVTYYLNGHPYYQVTEAQVGAAAWAAAVDHGFFLILDLAVGGGYPDGVCGCTSPAASTTSGASMSVGYVAVYTTTTSGSRAGGGDRSCAADAAAGISADCYTARQGGIDVTTTADSGAGGVDGHQAARLGNGDYLAYGDVNFGASGSTRFDARVASGAATGVSGLVEVVLDNPANPPVGGFAIGNTGGWSAWQTVPANISAVTGTHTVYLEFSSQAAGDPGFVSLHYFSFPAR
jgi:beta-glucanase (GH16 family)